MRNKTDLQNIKHIAKSLLNVSILETEYSPMIISHPFTKCGIVTLLDGDDFIQLDITKNKDFFNKWKLQISKIIDDAQNVFDIFYLLNESYRLMFFDGVAQDLSQEDYATLLGESWVSSEYANMDANVTTRKMLTYFKCADKSLLMSESEMELFNELEDKVIIYRGVSTKNKNNTKALSWTLSFGKAKWFAERWDNSGIVYSAIIDKSNILAYFNRKGEDEVIVDFNKLQDIKIVDKPQKMHDINKIKE